MKDFPRFTASTIQYSITQPQMKLLTAILADFIDQLELDHSTQKINRLNISANRNCGQLPALYLTIPEKLQSDCHDLLEVVIDAYVDKKMQYVDLVLQDLNTHFAENYDREVFDLADGQTLKIADSSSVYG